ncbi:UNVERIFIED_CONTAM: putative mitochondrial protein [Sesamum radiatum]|uniref:Mitochondrial protein n=1 Tax=Sesamum radiatum TaxID=300843 RepID=A0AAW2U8Q3_SESRA
MGYRGSWFTWCNRQEPPRTIREWLDRACCNDARSALFPAAVVSHIHEAYSGHATVLLSINLDQEWGPSLDNLTIILRLRGYVRRIVKPWLKKAWEGESGADLTDRLIQKIRCCSGELMRWNHSSFGNISRRIQELNEKLKIETSKKFSTEDKGKIEGLRTELEELLEREETMWKQRGKALWLKEGDCNTSFFHARATEWRHRRDRNDGNVVEGVTEIQQVIMDYFSNIFTSSHSDSGVIEEIVVCLEPKVSDAMNEELLRPFTSEEIKLALDAMHPLKSPGPDCISPIFFQKFWSIVGRDVSRSVLHILNHYNLNPTLNHTHVVLLPKYANPECVSEFRPISLCNVIYKLASKTIANQIKPILDNLISSSQSNFIPGHLILDNVIVAYEVNHYLAHKYQGNSGHVSLKLDLSKAYDCVEWIFLERVLLRLGFVSRFVHLIMLCVTSVSFSFMLNGKTFGHLQLEMGLCHGDPLFPYLFLLCAEAFSGLVRKEEEARTIRGVRVCRRGPRVTY